jgi:aryl-alcohol dehydrogenase-like predicted oxidoreductase
MSLTLQSTTKLHTGTQMPTLGYGVYLSERDKCVKSVSKALEVGYRHVDCAQYYENEDREF